MEVKDGSPIEYFWSGQKNESVNALIGQEIELKHTGRLVCTACQKEVKKLFGQGFCYPCFLKAPENSECIIKPELCRGHLGEGRDPEWELRNHVQPHVVYLALTSAIKVGITRKSNLVNRWVDQGAWKALAFAEVPNRFTAGQIEVALKDFLTDKTNWRKMLTDERAPLDLAAEKLKLKAALSDELAPFFLSDGEVKELHYPVMNYPPKVNSVNFDKQPVQQGVLVGIRGQYLYFEGGKVLNVRKFTGYEIELTVKGERIERDVQMTLF